MKVDTVIFNFWYRIGTRQDCPEEYEAPIVNLTRPPRRGSCCLNVIPAAPNPYPIYQSLQPSSQSRNAVESRQTKDGIKPLTRSSGKMKLKDISRTATFAWDQSSSSSPLIVTGAVAGALDATFSNESLLEIWQPDFGENGPVRLGGEGKGPLGSISVSSRSVSRHLHIRPSTDLNQVQQARLVPAFRQLQQGSHCCRHGNWRSACLRPRKDPRRSEVSLPPLTLGPSLRPQCGSS